MEKLMADLSLQVNDLLTERRLSDVATLCGTGEISGVSDREGVAKLVQFHRYIQYEQ